MHPSDLKASPARDQASGSKSGDVISGLVRVLMTLPTAFRAFFLLAILAIGGFVAYEKYVPPSLVRPNGSDHYYVGGVADPNHPGADTLNPQNLEADHKASEDDAAMSWHFNHKTEDDPSEVAIDAARQIYFRYFANTDHCVYVRRREGDRDLTQWVRDPNFHSHDVDKAGSPKKVTRQSEPNNRGRTPWSLARLLDRVVVTASAETKRPDALVLAPAQTTSCLNPHPGAFRYWWASPVDQCNSPMYRQFPDGCIHYQLYNRCANAWDSRIIWTTCVMHHNS